MEQALAQEFFSAANSPRLTASPAHVTENPERVDLGGLRPTGRLNPDGTEVWVPRDGSILVGSIEVDVRGDGTVVRQKVLRAQPVPKTALGFSLSPNVEERVSPRSSTSDENTAGFSPADPRRTETYPAGEWR